MISYDIFFTFSNACKRLLFITNIIFSYVFHFVCVWASATHVTHLNNLAIFYLLRVFCFNLPNVHVQASVTLSLIRHHERNTTLKGPDKSIHLKGEHSLFGQGALPREMWFINVFKPGHLLYNNYHLSPLTQLVLSPSMAVQIAPLYALSISGSNNDSRDAILGIFPRGFISCSMSSS